MDGHTVTVLLASPTFTGQLYIVDQPTQLAFTQQPTTTQAGVATSPAVTVAVEDGNGNTVTTDTSTVTLTLNGGTFASSDTSTVTVASVNGVATFSNLVIDSAGSYTLTASDAALATATSSGFTISPGSAAQLAFEQQPTTTGAGMAISPAVTVAVEDTYGNIVTTDNSSTVTLALNGGDFDPGSTVSAVAVNGVATFNNLVIDTLSSCTLTASDGTLTGAHRAAS